MISLVLRLKALKTFLPSVFRAGVNPFPMKRAGGGCESRLCVIPALLTECLEEEVRKGCVHRWLLNQCVLRERRPTKGHVTQPTKLNVPLRSNHAMPKTSPNEGVVQIVLIARLISTSKTCPWFVFGWRGCTVALWLPFFHTLLLGFGCDWWPSKVALRASAVKALDEPLRISTLWMCD